MYSWLRAIVPLVERSAGATRLPLALVGCLSLALAAACAPETARPPPPAEQPTPVAPAEVAPPAPPEPAVAPAPTPTPAPSPTPDPTPTPVDVPDELTDLAHVLRDLGLSDAELAEVLDGLHEDPEGDFFYAASIAEPGNPGDDIDIIRYGRHLVTLSREQADRLFNAPVFPCDTEADGRTVLCVDEQLRQPMPAGELAVLMMVMKGTVAADPSLTYFYDFLADTDGDPATNWVPFEPFDLDCAQGADFWLAWNPSPDEPRFPTEARFVAARMRPGEFPPDLLPSAARLVAQGNALVVFIPLDELGEQGFDNLRGCAARTSGEWQPWTSASDATGGLPTEPLTPW